MPTLRIKLPEKDEPSVIALRGDRITIGRRPDNTLQILDRTVSAYHAELLMEDGHYRVHDLGSSNGTFVEGEQVKDFHLREGCKVTFGKVDCEFSPAEVDQAPEGLPTQGELAALLKDNEALKAQLETVRTELAALRTESPLNSEGSGTVPREEFEKVVLDRASLSERLQRTEAQFAKVREELAILRRDRENLELAAESARKEVERLRGGAAGVTAKPVGTPGGANAPGSTPAPAAAPAEAMPKRTIAASPLPPAHSVPAAKPFPSAMPAAAESKPAMPTYPQPTGIPKPSSVPAAAPIASSPKAPTAAGVPSAMATDVRQAPGAGMLPIAVPRAAARPAPAGPAGTQKISVPGVSSANTNSGAPSATAGKTPLKPYVRPAVGAAAQQAGAPAARAKDPRLMPQPGTEEEPKQA